jgi:putative oligomerization/nucleic acid binding protein
MKRSSWRTAIALLAFASLAGCGNHGSPANAQDDALASLKNLRNRGVLTQAEYDAKVATLQGGTSSGLGEGASPGATAGPPETAVTLGGPGLGGGLGSGDNSFVGGAPAPAAAAPQASAMRPAAHRSARSPQVAPDAQDPQQAAAANSSPVQNGDARSTAVHNLLDKARADSAAVAHSAHDFALKLFGHGKAAAPPVPGEQDAQALQSYGEAVLRGADASGAASGAPTPGSANTPQR